MTSPCFAAIDCGSNSVRLLVARQPGETLERHVTVTGLAAGAASDGRLAPESIARTVSALAEFRPLIEQAEVAGAKFVATAAVRDAPNAEAFLSAAEAAVGLRPEVLSGEREAQIGFAGATACLPERSGPFLVADIGGGSSEFSYGSSGALCEGSVSCGVGSVRLTEQYLHHDPPKAEELYASLSVVEAHLEDVVAAMPQAGRASTFMGLAGTVTTAAAVEMGLAVYDSAKVHHFELSKAAAEDVFRTLATEDRAARLANPGLHPDRADVIVGGLCILVKIMRFFEFDFCLVSEADLLDGLIGELTAEHLASSQRSG